MRFPTYALATVVALCAITVAALPSSPRSRSEAALRTRSLPSSVHEGWTQGKRAEAAAPYTFTMALQSGDLDGLASKMDEIAAGSGEWLSDEELSQYAAPSLNTSDAALAFLTAAGISPSQITMSKHGDYVTVDTTVEQVESLFDTQLYDHVFESQHLAIRAPSGFALPQGLDEHIVDVSPLTHFGAPHATQAASALEPLDPADVEEALEQQKRQVSEMAQHFETRQSNSGNPSSCSGYKSFMSPACLRDLYQTSSAKAVAVAGQVDLGVVGIINASFNQDDLTAFAQRFRKDAAGFKMPVTKIRGAPFDSSKPDKEGTLDAQVVLGQSYPLNSHYYAWGSTKTGGDHFSKSWQDFINMDKAQRPAVLSYSYASQENWYSSSAIKSMCQTAQKLAALGTTIVVASGDNGVLGVDKSQSCSKSFVSTYPSVCPYVLSVGATSGIDPEVMMSQSDSGMQSGAGFSKYISRPSYQDAAVSSYLKAVGNANKGKFNAAGRAYPDVVAQGTKYVIRKDGGWYAISGTSAATPLWASIIALLNAQRRQAGKGTIGWANPTLYKASSGAFNDVTSGGSYGCSDKKSPGFAAAKGWDAAAGLGTPNYPGLAKLF